MTNNPFATTKNKYFDNFANTQTVPNGQSLNTPNYAATGQGLKTNPPRGTKSELDRLVHEREELVGTGVYSEADPLI
jgi:hypothetical protein